MTIMLFVMPRILNPSPQLPSVWMPREKTKGVNVTIRGLSNIGGQLEHEFAFGRRVNEEYVIPTDHTDKFISAEGLYPCSVVPGYDLGKTLTVVFRKPITYVNPNPDELLFKESMRGFDQAVVKRHIVPKKGKIYYGESEWIHDSSPEGMYPTLIFRKELVGKIVTLISQKD